jgi:hypothetical protein
MQASQLRPASELSKRYGVKCIVYGGPGSGKTPLIATAPKVVLLATEPGLGSMRNSNVATWEAHTPEKIDEFMKWALSSTELKQFDTIAIDSLSNLSELFLLQEQKNEKHGQKAYGQANTRTMKVCNDLYYMRDKHIVMIGKQTIVENGSQNTNSGYVMYEPVLQKRPYFPGKELNTKIPHLFDNIMHLCDVTMPGFQKPQRALRTKEIPEILARDRYGNLDDLEPPDLTRLFDKALNAPAL